jgi:hypothetical protein
MVPLPNPITPMIGVDHNGWCNGFLKSFHRTIYEIVESSLVFYKH